MAGGLYNAIFFFFFFVEKFFICCFFLIKPGGQGPCEPPAQKNIEFCQILKANIKKNVARNTSKFVEISNL